MESKGLVGSQQTFTGIDDKNNKTNITGEDPVKMDGDIAGWAKDQTEKNGVGVYIVSVTGGFHSLMLVVDRRGAGPATYRLMDQHGNKSTGSISDFDRTTSHTAQEINDYMLKMAQDWHGKGDKPGLFTGDYHNSDIKIVELKRD